MNPARATAQVEPLRYAGVHTVVRLEPPTRTAPVPIAAGQPTLDLELDPTPDLPARPHLDDNGRAALGRAGHGVESFARRFAQAVVEVIAGERGPQQLIRWTSPPVYEDLLDRSLALQRFRNPDGRGGRPGASVHSVHVSHPGSGVVEVCVHIRHGARSRAMAARLEHERDRWRCTALELG